MRQCEVQIADYQAGTCAHPEYGSFAFKSSQGGFSPRRHGGTEGEVQSAICGQQSTNNSYTPLPQREGLGVRACDVAYSHGLVSLPPTAIRTLAQKADADSPTSEKSATMTSEAGIPVCPSGPVTTVSLHAVLTPTPSPGGRGELGTLADGSSSSVPRCLRGSLFCFLLLFSVPALAQTETKPLEVQAAASGPAPGHSAHGEVFDEGPRQAAVLMGNTGDVHFPVGSKVPQVEPFINQGIGQLHGFWYFEAERSFRQAAQLDPDCATAYLGMALANFENMKRARSFIAEATKRKDKVSSHERMYIDAFEAFLKEEPKKEEPKDAKSATDKEKADKDQETERKRREKLAADLEKILHEHPTDLEAKALLGWHLWVSRAKHVPIVSYFAVDALLHDVLDKNPLHPCHHYIIHLWDYEKAERALDSASKCGQSAPGIAHMWHMPGHIYSKLNRYHDAVFQQEASARVDYAQMMRYGVLPDQIHNFAHNNEWLIRNLIHIGNERAAREMASNMLELPRHPKWNKPDRGGSSSGFGRARLLETLVEFEDWDRMLKLASDPHLEEGANDDQKIQRLQYLGLAAFGSGDFVRGCEYTTELIRKREAVEAEQKAAQTKARDDATTAMKSADEIDKAAQNAGNGFNGRLTPLRNAISDLEAQIHLAHRAFAEAQAALQKTTRVDRPLQARVHLAAGESDKGISMIRDYVGSHKNETIPLAQAVAILWQAGKKDDAKAEFEKLRKLSEAIDLESPVFRKLAPIAAELQWPADWRLPLEPRTDTGIRPELASLGPFRWEPSPAPLWSLTDHEAKPVTMAELHGKPVVLVFYLGSGCLHCVEQLHKFAPQSEAFSLLGIEVIGISTDSPADLLAAHKNYTGTFPFRLLSNPDFSVFKSYRCYDDFEAQPLHGTFLIAPDGRELWHDIGAEPFMDVEFLLGEARRALPLHATPTSSPLGNSTAAD